MRAPIIGVANIALWLNQPSVKVICGLAGPCLTMLYDVPVYSFRRTLPNGDPATPRQHWS